MNTAKISTDRRDTERNPLEVLAEEFAERHRSGQQPTIGKYAAKYPDLEATAVACEPELDPRRPRRSSGCCCDS